MLMMVGTGAIVFGLSAAALAGANVPARWIVLVIFGLLAGMAGAALAVTALVALRFERRRMEEMRRAPDRKEAASAFEPSVPGPVRIGLIVSIVLFVVVVIAVAAFFMFMMWALKDFRPF